MLLHPRFQWNHPTVQRLVSIIKEACPTFFSKKSSQYESEEEEEEGPEVESKPLPIDPLFVVAIWFLIEEKYNKDSRWRQYLDLLPPEFDCSTYWSSDTLEIIRGTNLFGRPPFPSLWGDLGSPQLLWFTEGTDQINSVIDQIFTLINTTFGVDSIQRKDVLWAYSIYASRCALPAFLKISSSHCTIQFLLCVYRRYQIERHRWWNRWKQDSDGLGSWW